MKQKNLLKVYIDKEEYYFDDTRNLLEQCLLVGLNIPYFCWHPELGSVGFCRQCIVKQYTNLDDQKGRLVVSCMTKVQNNMFISILDQESQKFRKYIIELMMTNHPHDCPVCSEGGNCHLQDMTVMTGQFLRKYTFEKRTYINQYLGPFIKHEMNRCISCYRCVRFYKDYAGGKDFGVYGIRNNIYFGRFQEGLLENEFSGNLIEICPTGVFTDKTQSNCYNRKWDLQYTSSICHRCSIGCNLIVGEKYQEISRIENRYNEDINGYFICDKGRFGYDYFNIKDCAISMVSMHDKFVKVKSIKKVLIKISEILKNGKNFIGIGSSRASLESNFLLKEFVGDDNFYLGITSEEYERSMLMFSILEKTNIYIPSLKEIENYDIIIILGEDITNTAPRMSLSIRQALKKKSCVLGSQLGIDSWHSDAILNLIKSGNTYPLFITSVDKTKLDDVATWVYYGSLENQARFAYSIASNLNNIFLNKKFLDVSNKYNKFLDNKIKEITNLLCNSKKPLVITGCNTVCRNMIHAAHNIALTLKKMGKDVGMNFVFSNVNSMGLIAIGGHPLEQAFDRISKKKVDNVFLLESNLYYYYRKSFIDNILKKIKNLIVIDYMLTDVAYKSSVFLPSTSFMESDGTVINYEGRAQRFFKLYSDYLYYNDSHRMEGWRWLDLIMSNYFKKDISYKDINKVIFDISNKITKLSRIKLLSSLNVNLHGKKIAKKTSRYSGRTSSYVKQNIHELPVIKEKDNIFTFSTEGVNISNKKYLSFYYVPGWNSVQSLNIIKNNKVIKSNYCDINIFSNKKAEHFKFYDISFDEEKEKSCMFVAPIWDFFGSEETSQQSKLLRKVIPSPYAIINTYYIRKTSSIKLVFINFTCNNVNYELPVKFSDKIAINNIGLTIGFFGIPFELLGKKVHDIKINYKSHLDV